LNFRTVILDLDGTILDGRFRHYACYSRILEEYGYAPVGLGSYRRMRRERANRRQQLAASGAEAIYEDFLDAWLERIEHPDLLALDRLQPGATEKLREWRAEGIRLVLATMRRYPGRLDEQLTRLGLSDFFDHVVACEHRLGSSGKAQWVKNTVAGLHPEHCLWVGDTELDIEAARALGCPVWVVTEGERTESHLALLSPDFLSPNLGSIDLRRCRGYRPMVGARGDAGVPMRMERSA
jgi:phosphoglycolate phosphatase-like HAD superfamily hydrolase